MYKKVNIITVRAETDLKQGDDVVLVKDEENKYDKNAVKCMKNGKFAGYVSAQEYTTCEGCMMNIEVIPYFKTRNEVKGVVKGTDTISYKNGKKAETFIVEIKIEENKKKNVEKDMKENIEILIGGLIKNYPKRIEVEKQLNEENLVVATIDLKNKEVLVGESPIGNIKQVKYKDNIIENYKDYIKDGSNVFIRKKEGRDLLGKIQISQETKNKLQKEDVEKVIEDIIKKKIDTEENMKEKLEYIEENNIPITLFAKVLKTYTQYDKESEALIKKPETLYIDKEGAIKRVLSYIIKNKNIGLIGDKASGKTTLAETVAWLFHRPVLTLSLSRDTDKYDIWGSKTIDYDNGKQKIIFQDGPLTKAIKKGYVVIFDEMNVADNSILVNMHSVLDHRKEALIPDIGVPIKAHKNFLAIATQNDATYQGTNKLNPALKSRFIWLKLDPITDIKELLIYKNPNTKPEVLEILNNIYIGMKDLIRNGEISEKSLDVRGFENVVDTYDEEILTLKDALIDCIANQADNEDDRQHIQNIIDMECL